MAERLIGVCRGTGPDPTTAAPMRWPDSRPADDEPYGATGEKAPPALSLFGRMV